MSNRIEKKFREAAEKGVLCELTDWQGRIRVVAPLGEFLTQHNHKCFATYQYSGYSAHKLPAFRSLSVDDFRRIKILDIKFRPHRDFNPSNRNTYHEWLWHLPRPEMYLFVGR